MALFPGMSVVWSVGLKMLNLCYIRRYFRSSRLLYRLVLITEFRLRSAQRLLQGAYGISLSSKPINSQRFAVTPPNKRYFTGTEFRFYGAAYAGQSAAQLHRRHRDGGSRSTSAFVGYFLCSAIQLSLTLPYNRKSHTSLDIVQKKPRPRQFDRSGKRQRRSRRKGLCPRRA